MSSLTIWHRLSNRLRRQGWTVEEAIRLRVPVPSIAAALFARFLSRQDDSPTMKAVAALRNQFGGHAVKRVSESG